MSEESANVESADVEASEEEVDHSPKIDLDDPEIQAAEEEELQKELAKELRKKYKAKVNGREQEVEVNLNDDEEVRKYIQKAMASDEKFREAATIRKQMESLVSAMKDPNELRKILTHPSIGMDIKEFAASVLNEAMEEELKTPEQKEQEQIRKELQEKNAKLEELENRARQAELARIEEQEFRQLDLEITAALESLEDLPKSAYTVKRLTDAMIDAVNAGYVDVTVQDVLPYVQQSMVAEHRATYDQMTEEQLEKLIGTHNINRLRKKRLARRKAPVETAKSVKDSGQKTDKDSKSAKKPEKEGTFSDIFGVF